MKHIQSSPRYLYIQIMRILFTVYIILMHSESMYRSIETNRIMEGGYFGVDFFFIVSGFYIAGSVFRKGPEPAGDLRTWVRGRLKRLYPHYALSIFVLFCYQLTHILNTGGLKEGLLSLMEQLQALFWNLLMFQNLGLGIPLLNGYLWYVTYLFLGEPSCIS